MRVKDPSREIMTESRLSSLYFSFSYADLIWVLVFGMFCVAVLRELGIAFASIGALVLIAFSLIRFLNGRAYMLVVDRIGNMWIRHVKKGKIWRPNKKSSYYPDLLNTILKVNLPDRDEPVGFIRPDNGNGLCAVILGSGWSTAAKSRVEQRRALAAMGRKFKMLRNIGISDLFTVRPYNPWPNRDFNAIALDPLVFLPVTDEEVADANKPWANKGIQQRGRFLQAVTDQEEQVNARFERNITEAQVLFVKGNKMLTRRKKKKKDKPLTPRDYDRSPVIKAARSAVQQLRKSGVPDARIASYREVLAFVRSSWDGADTERYYDDEHKGVVVTREYVNYLPTKEVSAFPTHLEIDGVFIAMVKATAQRPVVVPDVYRSLHSILDNDGLPICYTLGKIGANVSATLEKAWLDRLIPGREAIQGILMATSYRSTATRNREEESRSREERLGSQEYHPHDYLPVGLVFAKDIFTLEDRVSLIVDAFTELELEPANVVGERQQLRVLKSMTGANRM